MRDELFAAPPGYAPRSAWQRECSACGACCAAPDIAALNKPLGVACSHLNSSHLDGGCRCLIYAQRPAVCRNYQPDWVCGEVSVLPTLEARVARFLEIYGLTGSDVG